MEYMVDDMERELSNKISSNECPKCGEPITGSVCKKCGEKGLKEQYYDPDYAEYEKQVEKENKDYEKELKNLEWEEVKDDA